ncbi:MAG TPA: pilus assembly protein TadG-related protein [Pedococcus sp.]|jgi:hypothetical protein|nr:pilus assembly protein TadG-related protein [Pedococcus sp.]
MKGRTSRWATRACIRHGETGQIALLTLGFTVLAMALILGTVAVTSVQLSRLRLLDAADGAALDAANSLDSRVYHQGLGASVGISSATVRRTAGQYLAERPRPPSLLGWHLAPGTGSPDGQTAVVRISGEADVPFVGGLLSSLGGSVTITVESRARAPVR